MSNVFDMDLAATQRACCGNQSAMDFLANHWAPYLQEVDDIVDGERTDPEEILSTFARAIMVYSHPFYLEHLMELRAVTLLIGNAYADSVMMEKSSVDWHKEWADHFRHIGGEMVFVVAMICGGYQHARGLSLELRSVWYDEHHTREGKAE